MYFAEMFWLVVPVNTKPGYEKCPGGGEVPRILDRDVPQSFLNPNPI